MLANGDPGEADCANHPPVDRTDYRNGNSTERVLNNGKLHKTCIVQGLSAAEYILSRKLSGGRVGEISCNFFGTGGSKWGGRIFYYFQTFLVHLNSTKV